MTAKRASTRKEAGRAVVKTRAAGAPLAAPGDGDGAGGFVTEGFIRVTINKQEFELRGTIGDHLKVAWHKPFDQGVDLGTAPEMAGEVAGALKVADADTFTKDLNDKLTQAGQIPIIGGFADFVKSAHVKVTDLAVDTEIGRYQFGFGWDLSTMEGANYKGISIDAFGLVFTHTTTKKAE